MKSLTLAFEELLWAARGAFAQHRTYLRARKLVFGFVLIWGRHTISRALCAVHDQFKDWSASYRLFSRAPWTPNDLFKPVMTQCLALSGASLLLAIALDDTSLPKTSKHIPGVSYARDPMSPKFHPNLILGQRFIQASWLLRPEGLQGPARGFPVRFVPAPPPVKPGKKASEEQRAAYRHAQKTENLSCRGSGVIKDLREELDGLGAKERTLHMFVDGSYCNRTTLRNLPDRVELTGRTRGDITLFAPPTPEQLVGRGRRRKYGSELPKPKDMLNRDEFASQQAEVFGAGRVHQLRFKEVSPVFWKSGARDTSLRLIIVAPLRYRPNRKSRLLYRDPAFLLTTDLTTPAHILIQAYFDRWEIEVNHREEKSLFGVGQPQVWSQQAAPRVPQFQVAIYSMLLLASLLAYGPKRTDQYPPLPRWRKQEEHRPSIEDILQLLREELLARAVATDVGSYGFSGGRRASRPKRLPLTG